MAEKEATVFILDLGASMARANAGRDESDLDWCMRYVWDKITDIVAANRKTLCVGVVGLRTDETKNKLQADDGYENISVLQGLGQMTMSSLRTLRESIQPSNTCSGDAISAIVVAVDMIDGFTKRLKWLRKIVLVTDGKGDMDADDTADISKKMNDLGIQLTILGVDFDDPEYGFKEEDKPPTKAANESTLRKLADACQDGIFATMAEAIGELQVPRVKSIKPYKTYDGPLTLGDPATLPCAMNINVERFFGTHLARPLGASTVVVNSEPVATQSTRTLRAESPEGADFAAVKQARAYKVNDPEAPGGKRDVEFQSLARGYEYGRTAVHISESEHNITQLESKKSFSIVGFIPWNKYEPFLSMGEMCATHARNGDAKSELAMSSLVWALMELESYAIARIVVKDGKEPLLVLLAPHIEPDIECLYDVPLPFAEDVRSYQFPPLDKVITVSGQTLTKHRLLPTNELNEAMSDYVDAMDLSTYGAEGGMGSAEYAPIDETFNPSIHRINHAVRMRAVHPDKPVPPTPPVLLQYCAPPEDLIERVQSRIKALIEVAGVKKVPPKAKGRRPRESIKPISGLDIDALLGETKEKGQVSRENAIPDFKRALAAAASASEMDEVAKQMGSIVRGLVTDSFGDSRYEQAMECMGVMRDELVSAEEPGIYNSFVRDLKKALLSGALGGDRRDYWYMLRTSRLGLISKDQSEASAVSPEQAEEFYSSR
ncbi:ATP-dependent DNA helicase II subunit 2 [Ophiocordyceps camponoti-floridani]|uniref:ATP-dependent DNA helicase II subunit 2 n=1 Tax=Ophiocordyceps camponoti-floridani TaxID=2030778 RepID=A0A8H4Q6S6_9HYPO|nr:ATP-dependent DNA helicase II subunit 2 [Ophiocordyceps camponoti-floridani]